VRKSLSTRATPSFHALINCIEDFAPLIDGENVTVIARRRCVTSANISIRTGKKLKWDPAKEAISGDAETAKWVNKPYRAPWKLPVA